MSYQTKLFINNEYVPSRSGKTFPVFNPVDNSHVADVHEAGKADIDLAVTAAQAAYDGPWGNMKKQERARIILKFADLIEVRVPELRKLHTVCIGIPTEIAAVFCYWLPQMLRYNAGYCDKVTGDAMEPDGDGSFKIVMYEPYGVCAGVAAWNAGYLYEAWKIPPAVAAGNCYIFKSSEKAPLASLALGELVKEAGFPPGVINILSGAGETGALLASHMGIQKIAFTGSESTGRIVAKLAAESNLKSVSLELSGKSPALVFDDADLNKAIEGTSTLFLINSGQYCTACSRILVQESIAEKFIEGIKEAFETLTGPAMGDPTLKETFLGPLVDQEHFGYVMSYIDSAKQEGIELLAGGARKGERGTFMQPTLFKNPGPRSKIWRDDIFGPVAMVKTFKDEEEAIRMANDTDAGLAAQVFTSSYPRALRVARKLQVGSVGINGNVHPSYEAPFGGWKQSGYGREGGKEGFMNYLQAKHVRLHGI